MPPPIPLSYATSLQRRRHFHIFLLPLLWLPAGIGSRFYAHDFGYLLVFLPAVPLFTLPPNYLGTTTLLNMALAFTLLVVIGVGHFLDHTRAPRWIHLVFPPILLLAVVSPIFVANFRTGLQSIPPPPLPGPWHPLKPLPRLGVDALPLRLRRHASHSSDPHVFPRPFCGVS